MKDQRPSTRRTASGFSRRAFLKGSGAAAAATALATGRGVAEAADDKVESPRPGPTAINAQSQRHATGKFRSSRGRRCSKCCATS